VYSYGEEVIRAVQRLICVLSFLLLLSSFLPTFTFAGDRQLPLGKGTPIIIDSLNKPIGPYSLNTDAAQEGLSPVLQPTWGALRRINGLWFNLFVNRNGFYNSQYSVAYDTTTDCTGTPYSITSAPFDPSLFVQPSAILSNVLYYLSPTAGQVSISPTSRLVEFGPCDPYRGQTPIVVTPPSDI
jgi:hypothetical protein